MKPAAISLLSLLCLSLVSAVAWWDNQPPAAAAVDADSAGFSSARALRDLQEIAKETHPVGTAAHAKVRDFIITRFRELGFEVQMQKTVSTMTFIAAQSATVENIIARKKGTANTRALMLASHYDSRYPAPGAGDAGYAPAAFLEIARALKYHRPLKNDLIFLITDGEELGLLGAKAFVEESPVAKEIGVVLNFEGRGISGPSIMFETNEDNGWIIQEFSKGVSRKNASSFSYDIYKRLPNNTDFTVFKRKQMTGLNFGHIGSIEGYHASIDDVEHLSERTVQHHGVQALDAVLHFGNADLSSTTAPDEIYFSFLLPRFIHYPASWNLSLVIITSVVFVGILIVGFSTRKLRLLGSVLSSLVALVRLGLAVGAAYLLCRWLPRQHQEFEVLGDFVYSRGYYLMGIIFLAVAIATVLNNWLIKKVGELTMAVGPLLIWTAIMWLSAMTLPRGSYLFTFPLAFTLIGTAAALLKSEDIAKPIMATFLTVCAIPGFYVIPQLIDSGYQAMGLMPGAVFAGLIILLVGSIQILMSVFPARQTWILTTLSFVLSLTLFGVGLNQTGFTEQRRKPNSIFYAKDFDIGRASWSSWESLPDAWTGQFLKDRPDTIRLASFFPQINRPILCAGASQVELEPPIVALVKNSKTDSTRTLALRIRSHRGNSYFLFYTKTPIVAVTVNGKAVERPRDSDLFRLYYYGNTIEPIEINLTVPRASALPLKVVEHLYGMPETLLSEQKPRPPWMMPRANSLTDMTVTVKTFVF